MKEEYVPQEIEPEEMKWLTQPPRKLSGWVTLRLSVGDMPIFLSVFGWILVCFCMLPVFKMLRDGEFDPGYLILTPFLILGLACVVPPLFYGRRNRWLLENGEIGKGKMLASKMWRHKGADVSLWVKYQFTAEDGRTHEASVRISPKVIFQDTAYQVIFYDKNAPGCIFPYAALAASEISQDQETGELHVTSVMARVYAAATLAVHLFFATVLVLLLGVIFR